MPSPTSVGLLPLALCISMILAAPSMANVDDVKATKASAFKSLDTDQLIIRFRDTADTTKVDKVLTRLKNEKKQQFRFLKNLPNQAAVFKFNQRKKSADWSSLVTWLKADPDVEYVEPDFLLQAAEVSTAPATNDSYLSYQWPLLDSTTGINAPAAWPYSTGLNTVVAVVDSGVRPHIDLAPNLLPGFDFITDTFVANDGDGRDADATDPGDYINAGECNNTTGKNSTWHGTHVAGTIAAVANNAEGIAGVAYNAKLLPVRVLGKCGGYTSDIASAIIWSAGGSVYGVPANPHPARVINLSLGGSNSCGTTLQNAINSARSRNAVVVVAAGNNNSDANTFAPANCNGVVTVAATGRDGGKAYYSNYGSVVEIAAPGGTMNQVKEDGVVSTLNTGTTLPEADTYTYYQGTSMATPHVAGTAALLLSLKPTLTPDEVSHLLTSTAKPFPQTCTSCGSGIVDAAAAVQAVINSTPTEPEQPDPYTQLTNELQSNKALWTAKRILNYTYDLSYQTGSATALRLRLVIKSGRLSSGTNLATNRKLTSYQLRTYGLTIDQLFTKLNTALLQKPAQMAVSYNSAYGYPTQATIDPQTTQSGDEWSFTVSNFKP